MAKKSEIEKLSEKVEKDPSSTLFVRLADEYRKAGRLDEAIEVLTSGIERQPGYMSARVALGKIYLQKGMLTEARDVFGQVAEAVPDNLFAHRKLADIHRELGDLGHALVAYETVVGLSPMDEEAQDILRQLKEGGVEPPPPEELEPEAEEAPPQDVPEPEAAEEEPEAPPEDLPFEDSEMIGLDEAPDWSKSFTSEDSEEKEQEESHEGDIPPVDLSALREDLMPPVEETVPEADEPPAEEPQAEMEEIAAAVAEASSEVVEPPAEEPPAEVEEAAAVAEETVPEVEEPPVEESQTEIEKIAAAVAEETVPEVEEPPVEETPAEVEEAGPVAQTGGEAEERMALADSLIREGRYTEAMDLYNARLEKSPGDRTVLQRVEELKGLLKLLGKDTEQVELKLQAFLDAIKARRDEFFRHSERHG